MEDNEYGGRPFWPLGSLCANLSMSHLLLQLIPGNQLVHPFQKDLAACLALLVLVLGFGEGHLAHDGNESCAIGDDAIIANFGKLLRGSLNTAAAKSRPVDGRQAGNELD